MQLLGEYGAVIQICLKCYQEPESHRWDQIKAAHRHHLVGTYFWQLILSAKACDSMGTFLSVCLCMHVLRNKVVAVHYIKSM